MSSVEEIEKLIINYNKYLWENSISKRYIEDWLSNFKGDVEDESKEKDVARKLLLNFIYYSENEIKYLCKISYIKFKQIKIKELVFAGKSVSEAEELFNTNLRKYRFFPVGRPSESAGYISYLYRQINDLPISLFPQKLEDVPKETKCLIVVDDFLGTGDTIIHFWKNSVKQKLTKFPHIELYCAPLIALKKGVENVEENTEFKVICPQIFDEEYRVFSDESFVFSETDERDDARQICQKYGEKLEGTMYALGYKDSQAILGFHHNIPNNTLAIIWSNKNGWSPIFSRKKKRYK